MSRVKLGYNPTLKQATLEQELELCEKYGFDAIELRIEKLKDYFTRNTLADLKSFFEQSTLQPLSLNAIEYVLFSDSVRKEANNRDLAFLCEVGYELGIRDIVIVPSFHKTEYSMEAIKQESIQILTQYANKVKKYNMRLAYEFVGNPNACVNTFEQCYDIVESIGLDNVGISLDFFHFYAMNSSKQALQEADIEKIFLVHINDADFYPPGSLREEEDRLFPGDGAIPIKDYMDILKDKNYQGLVSIELFRKEYEEWDMEEFIKTAKEKTSYYLQE